MNNLNNENLQQWRLKLATINQNLNLVNDECEKISKSSEDQEKLNFLAHKLVSLNKIKFQIEHEIGKLVK